MSERGSAVAGECGGEQGSSDRRIFIEGHCLVGGLTNDTVATERQVPCSAVSRSLPPYPTPAYLSIFAL